MQERAARSRPKPRQRKPAADAGTKTATAVKLDPVDYAVISQGLIAAAREMGVKLIRSAYSTILREAQDGSAALMDRDGNVVLSLARAQQEREWNCQRGDQCEQDPGGPGRVRPGNRKNGPNEERKAGGVVRSGLGLGRNGRTPLLVDPMVGEADRDPLVGL